MQIYCRSAGAAVESGSDIKICHQRSEITDIKLLLRTPNLLQAGRSSTETNSEGLDHRPLTREQPEIASAGTCLGTT